MSDEHTQHAEVIIGYQDKSAAQAVTIARLRKALALAITAIDSLPQDVLGVGGNGMTHWWVKDELLEDLRGALKERTG